MADQDWLSIDHKTCSPSQLAALIEQLEGAGHDALRLILQREMIDRLRDKGIMDRRIIEHLLRGVGSRAKRDKIAKEWSSAFGLTPKEFKCRVLGN